MSLVNGFVCDNQKCSKGPNETRMQVIWDADLVKANPEAMPDQFYKFNNWQPVYIEGGDQTQASRVFQFCSPECTREFLREVKQPRSPRELMALEQANKEVENRRKADLEAREAKRAGEPAIAEPNESA